MSRPPVRAGGSSRAALSRERIAEAALAIADADGLAAVSMRRLAGELGVGTMSLYHYVRDKDDLYGLVGDRIMGELLVPEDEFDPADWRAALGAIARHSRAVFRRHPWVFTAITEGGSMSINVIRHFEQSLAAVSQTGVAPAERLELIAIVDDFVFGHGFRTALEAESREFDAAMRATALDVVDSGEFPQMRALLGDGDRAAAWAKLEAEADADARFERGLEAVLDGLQARLQRG
jgi:AcrR family transcriptional regulator